MINAFEKFLNFINGSFWDWQFFIFVFFAVLVLCFTILDREKPLETNRVINFLYETIGKSDALNCLIIIALNVVLVIAAVSITGIPVPQTHDEFGYLLAAETFSHGRLANPTPFSPRHFESFHILVEPVYAAKFPPLQGFFLAIGILLTGIPVTGVWISGILSSLAIYWLLRSYFSLRWAVFGTILWIFAPLNLVWLNSYWGAHCAVTGGALSAGAVFRYLKKPLLKYLIIWGLGIFALLNSRLYEGTLLTAILASILIFETLKSEKLKKQFWISASLLIFLALINSAWIAFYNYSVTGQTLVLPYVLHQEKYHRAPIFAFQSIGEPKPEIPVVIKNFDERWLAEFSKDYKNPQSAVKSTVERIPIYLIWLTRSPFLLMLFLTGLFWLIRNKEKSFERKIPMILGLFLVTLFLTTFKGDRYVAVIVGLTFVSMTLAARMLYRKGRFWKPFVLALPLIVGGGFISGLIWLDSKRIPLKPVGNDILSRTQITDFLKSLGGKHLIFLETDKANPADARFYVYNEAEIGDALIIWAHNLSESENRVLIENNPNRKTWLLKNIENRAVLKDYQAPE